MKRPPYTFRYQVLPLVLVAVFQVDAWAGQYESALIRDVPHVKQKPDFCGEACVEMALRKLGHAVTQDDVFDASGADPEKGRGCVTRELARAMTAIGFKTGMVHGSVNAGESATGMEEQWKALHADLAAGLMSIVCMHYDDKPDTSEHFRLVTGYESGTDEVIYNEPAVDGAAGLRMKRSLFMKLWPLKYTSDRWTVIRLRCEPDSIAEAGRPAGFRASDFCQHVMAVRKKLPGPGFTICVQPPFVVIGDEDPETVRMRSLRTVKWAVEKLKQDYFGKDPARIIDIWLFRDKKSYERNALAVFGDRPTTPFGYFSEANQALVMNIATGGGTLIHEILHPLTRANFRECPAWFFEGLGSLYEQSSEKDGHIVGLTNWRLAGLQEALEGDGVPTFKELTGMSDGEFYSEDRGTNYAQARYLCYYLQQNGLLIRFYKEFVANCEQDPTGYASLKKVLRAKDMAAFEKKWKDFVLGLTFP